MKNKKLITFLCIVSAISYFGTDMNVVSQNALPSRSISNIQKPVQIISEVKETKVEIPSGPSEEIREDVFKSLNIQKGKRPKLFKGVHHPALPAGLLFAEGIYAVKSSEYTLSLGEKVHEKNGYVFFSSDEKPLNVTNVVVEKGTNKLFTVSSVLKLENIDENKRNTIISKGLEEHYYHEDLKILYVQSTQEDLLKLHEELAEENLYPEIEVVRAYHQAK